MNYLVNSSTVSTTPNWNSRLDVFAYPSAVLIFWSIQFTVRVTNPCFLFTNSGTHSREFAPVKIKTIVASASLERAVGRASVDLNSNNIGDARFREYLPDAHFVQLLHQLLVSASEPVIFFELSYCDSLVLDGLESLLEDAAKHSVLWAHDETGEIPLTAKAELSNVLRLLYQFWKTINKHIYKMMHFNLIDVILL
jgi:hypothetical protein